VSKKEESVVFQIIEFTMNVSSYRIPGKGGDYTLNAWKNCSVFVSWFICLTYEKDISVLCDNRKEKSFLLYENMMAYIERQTISSFSALSFHNTSGILLNCRSCLYPSRVSYKSTWLKRLFRYEKHIKIKIKIKIRIIALSSTLFNEMNMHVEI
jgi:hypothetical protein